MYSILGRGSFDLNYCLNSAGCGGESFVALLRWYGSPGFFDSGLQLICIFWSLLRGFAFICGLCMILWQANWFINITDILLSHNTGLYLLHRKKIDIYANICLFLYSLEPIWSVSSPDGHCSHQIQSVFRSDGGSAPRDDLYSSERQRRSWKILVLRVTPSNKILREFLEMWAFPLKI